MGAIVLAVIFFISLFYFKKNKADEVVVITEKKKRGRPRKTEGTEAQPVLTKEEMEVRKAIKKAVEKRKKFGALKPSSKEKRRIDKEQQAQEDVMDTKIKDYLCQKLREATFLFV